MFFSRKLVRGGADHSYGIEVARMAGLPSKLLQRAKILLEELESQEIVNPTSSREMKSPQMTLFDESEPDPLRERLKDIDPDKITPMQALLLLAELKQQLN